MTINGSQAGEMLVVLFAGCRNYARSVDSFMSMGSRAHNEEESTWLWEQACWSHQRFCEASDLTERFMEDYKHATLEEFA